MNSDPFDTATWRSLGMLDADESAAFDEAARQDSDLRTAAQEMDRLSAAIAVITSHPVPPGAGHLERIRSRLSLPASSRRSHGWAISGWAAAAALAMLLVWQQNRPIPTARSFTDSQIHTQHPPLVPNTSEPSSPHNQQQATPAHLPGPGRIPSTTEATAFVVRKETERLTGEIAALRQQLDGYQQRDKTIFQASPGIALPVIMRMSPPGSQPADDPTLAMNDSPLPQLFVFRNHTEAEKSNPAAEPTGNFTASFTDVATTSIPTPSAIPIYDAARDAGTLVVTNLPAPPEGQEYNLWVQTNGEAPPVRVGILPNAGTSPSESFDFSLGTHQSIPAGFILTRDPVNQSSPPTEENTILLGPQAAQP